MSFIFVDINQLRIMPEDQLKAFLAKVRDSGIVRGAAMNSFNPLREMEEKIDETFIASFEKAFPGFLKESTENYFHQLRHSENAGFAEAFRRLENYKYVSTTDPRFTDILEEELKQFSFGDHEIDLAKSALGTTIKRFLEEHVKDPEKTQEDK